MKVFIRNILLYLCMLFLFAWSFEYFINYELINGKRYYFQADWHDLSKHNSNVVFIGNSRIYRHIDPFMAQRLFNVKAEILAESGQGVQILWLKFKKYILGNNIPNEIYVLYDPYFLKQKKQIYGLDNIRTGFYNDRINLTSLSDFDGYENYYRFLPLSAITPSLFLRILFNITVNKNKSFSKTHGFLKQDFNWEGDWNHPEFTVVDSISNYIDSFVVYAKKNQVKLYLIYTPQSSPSYNNVLNKERLLNYYHFLMNKYDYDFTYLNYNHFKEYNDSTLFYNHMHLNSKGVNVFMNQFLQDSNSFKSYRKYKNP